MSPKYPPIVQVDDFGRVIGPVEFNLAHTRNLKPETRGIRHRTANAFIFEDTSYQRMLITKRGSAVNRAGCFDMSAGGHAEWLVGEGRAQKPLETVVCEIKGELFYHRSMPVSLIRSLRLVAEFQKDLRPYDSEFVSLFDGVCPGPFGFDSEEVAEMSFRDISEVWHNVQKNPGPYTKTAHLCLLKYLEKRGTHI